MYPGDYVTLTAFKLDKDIEKTTDDAKIRRYIRQASQLWNVWTRRAFLPYTDTRLIGPDYVRGSVLRLPADLLAVTSITDAAGAVLGAVYTLRPDNVYPKTTVELISGLAWGFADTDDRVQIAGTWGYHTHYARAWLATDTVQDDPLTTGSTTLNVTSGAAFEVLNYLLVEDEQMQVTAISTNALTVKRGVNGTSAAQHAKTTAVKVYQQLDDVQFAVSEVAKWLYEHRDKVNTGVQLAENLGVVIVRELPEVKELAEFYAPHVLRIGAI